MKSEVIVKFEENIYALPQQGKLKLAKYIKCH